VLYIVVGQRRHGGQIVLREMFGGVLQRGFGNDQIAATPGINSEIKARTP